MKILSLAARPSLPSAKRGVVVQGPYGGRLRTGGLARPHQGGFLFIIDRGKKMLTRGGENIYCMEVDMKSELKSVFVDTTAKPPA